MPIYKPTELLDFLNGLGISPRKALSQNFLIDGNIIRKIAKAAHVEKDDVILEIGSGPGSLTEVLLDSGALVLAVEKDKTLAQALARLQNEQNKLEVFCEDIREFPIEEVLRKRLKDHQRAKVIANLPYHLTTPIIASLVPLNKIFSSLTLMVQDEVARRFTAKPGTSDYSSFTLFLNFFSDPEYAFTVSKNCFYPIPKVESAVVILNLKEPPAVSNREQFFEMTRTAFEQRRKMLRGSLRKIGYSSQAIMDALSELNCPPEARPEELSLEKFLSLFEKLQLSK